MSQSQLRAAVDIGGTFTDVQVLVPESGRVWDFKTPTTPRDPSIGLINGLRGAAERYGFALSDIGLILHGSTIATNAVLERRLPKGALVTTRRFRDVLEIGRHMRHNVYALKAESRALLIPRDRRFEVDERVLSDGTVERAVDRGAVAELGAHLAEDGITAVAVGFLNGYRNPKNERAAAEVLSAIPGLHVTTSFETSPEIREFERMSTTVLNALLKPVISDYLERVETQLGKAGITARLFLVQSNGGLATPAEAARLPARLLLSGPSGGAMAMVDLARKTGLSNVVGIDMGGTSSDISVVQNGQIEETADGEIDGLPVRLPMVEIRTIGAGGGSLARVEGDALRVGPASAGAEPGPACYLRGGTEPTVTDANLHLGLIDPGRFLGGEMPLGQAEATQAIARVAGSLNLPVEVTAAGIRQIATASMAGAIRLSLFEKGADPSDFTLAAFGGAGGLHACEVAEELEIRRVIFPTNASTLSARGILMSDLRHDLMHSELLLASTQAVPRLAAIVEQLRQEGQARLAEDGMEASARSIEIFADMRYRGQAFEINTPWADVDDVTAESVTDLVATFHKLHQARYAHSAESDPVEIVTVRAKALGLLDRVETSAAIAEDSAQGSRRIWWDGAWHTTPVLPRAQITSTSLDGPLAVDEAYSVLWIGPGWRVHALDSGDLMAERDGGNS
ncbi:MAG: hydantoinase/oxoprolinase family protein [Pseudomonadota bacterium]